MDRQIHTYKHTYCYLQSHLKLNRSLDECNGLVGIDLLCRVTYKYGRIFARHCEHSGVNLKSNHSLLTTSTLTVAIITTAITMCEFIQQI